MFRLINHAYASAQLCRARLLEQNFIDQATAIIAVTTRTFERERSRRLCTDCDDFIRKLFQESLLLDEIFQHLGVQYIDEFIDLTEAFANV